MNSEQPTLPNDIHEVVAVSLAEDIGSGDITAELIDRNAKLSAKIVSKDSGVFCGRPWADEAFRQVDAELKSEWHTAEGGPLSPGQTVAQISGSARSILTAERTVLNFLQTLSAASTASHYHATLVKHTSVKLLDTRKTLPSLRTAQKYAVRVGGCFNHRMGLFDAFLIKENHINACGGISAAITAARELYPDRPVEIEVQNLDELDQALAAAADIVMLDNFSLENISRAVKTNAGRVKLEASGGIDEGRLVTIAESGVDYISLGVLTKNCKAIDLSLLVD